MFGVHRNSVSIYWVALGLKVKTRHISKSLSYQYVEINDLYSFLEQNQNIWDSRLLETNILGKEPEWLKEKRKTDQGKDPEEFGLGRLTKQQLVLAKKYFLDNREDLADNINIEESFVKSIGTMKG